MNRSGQIAVVLLTGIVLGSLAVAADNVKTVPGQTPPSLAQEREQLMKLKMTEFEKYKGQAIDKSLDRDKRAYAVLRIAELGSKEAAAFLASMWDGPLNVMDQEKLRLIDLCYEFGGPDCVPMLLKATRQNWSDERWHAARALAKIQGEEALAVLTKLAETDSDGIVRSQTQEYIKALADVRKADVGGNERPAVLQAVIAWGKTPVSGPYMKGEVVYLLEEQHTKAVLENESLRLYSLPELRLLGKMFDSYAVRDIAIANGRASALLKHAVDPPDDPVPFPFAGWRLKLAKTDGKWTVTEAIRNEVPKKG